MVNFRVTHQNGIDTQFQGFIQITEPVQINFRLSIHGLICDGNLDRICRHAFVRKFGYVCRKLHEADRPWYEFIKKRFTCPIPTGYYNMGKVTININSLSFLPLIDGYWIIKVKYVVV
ncbi:hypothetical protein ILUMI_19925 [Ignelater luminosus]|uniref:Uncharacterized protein n=1 Tax=Ignelater luminosus TaxID=2038154 RepID=A0A8K0CHA1_IGNLU|nr:hypothetical protein ILUMI_19925 [Ignelater luminosus]